VVINRLLPRAGLKRCTSTDGRAARLVAPRIDALPRGSRHLAPRRSGHDVSAGLRTRGPRALRPDLLAPASQPL